MNIQRDVPHYSTGGLEVLSILKAKMSAEAFQGFLLGNTLKYLFRYQHKGNPKDDLLKARTYLTWLIEEQREDGHVPTDVR